MQQEEIMIHCGVSRARRALAHADRVGRLTHAPEQHPQELNVLAR
jgi:hypothetical protein